MFTDSLSPGADLNDPRLAHGAAKANTSLPMRSRGPVFKRGPARAPFSMGGSSPVPPTYSGRII